MSPVKEPGFQPTATQNRHPREHDRLLFGPDLIMFQAKVNALSLLREAVLRILEYNGMPSLFREKPD
jgi:hypothetical protein